MAFYQPSFALFLAALFAIYWGSPRGSRPWILTAAGYLFYAFSGPRYLLFLLYVTACSRACTLAPVRFRRLRGSRGFLALSVALLLLPLLLYKGLGFFDGRIAVPVGLSFYTFQAVGLVVDLHTGRRKESYRIPLKSLKAATGSPDQRSGAEWKQLPSLREHLLFLAFFPQLLSGPIGRTEGLLPQLSDPLPAFSGELAWSGMRRFFWGLFKKAALADTLAANVHPVFQHPDHYHGFALLAAAFMFSLEIYCDFSGYTDMAIGSASLFGIRLDENFRYPYLATSIRDFWSRWHISLSRWLRDYVYIPLGGNRRGRLRSDANLLATFLISGAWHGSGLTFLVWGLIHGILQVIERHLPSRRGDRAPSWPRQTLRRIFTFALVTAAWVFFRAASVPDALAFFLHSWDGIARPWSWIAEGLAPFQSKKALIVMTAVLSAGEWALIDGRAVTWARRLPGLLLLGADTVFLLFLWYMLPVTADHPFLYFAF